MHNVFRVSARVFRLGFATILLAVAGEVLAAPPAPNKPLSGKLHGRDFKLDRATLEDGGLELRQGTNFFADLSVKIYLNPKEGESLEGKAFKVGGGKDAGFSNVQIRLKWVEKEDDLPKTEMFGSDEFSLVLEFGKRVNYNMPGKISLTLKDKMKSHLEGTFTIGPTDDESAWGALINGKILLKGGTNGLAKALGSAGKTIGVTVNTFELGPDGKVEGPGASVRMDGQDGGYICASWRPRNSAMLCDKTGTITHRQVNRPPGNNLVMLRGTAREPAKENETSFVETEYDGCLDWKWLVIKDAKERINLDLTLDPSTLGKLEVAVTNAPPKALVSYMPLDPAGNLPLPDALTYYGSPRRKLVDGKVVINWLKEGKYRLLPVRDYMDEPSKSGSQMGFVDVEIKRGAISKVALTWQEEGAGNTVFAAPGDKQDSLIALRTDIKWTLSPLSAQTRCYTDRTYAPVLLPQNSDTWLLLQRSKDEDSGWLPPNTIQASRSCYVFVAIMSKFNGKEVFAEQDCGVMIKHGWKEHAADFKTNIDAREAWRLFRKKLAKGKVDLGDTSAFPGKTLIFMFADQSMGQADTN